jgi:SAM-dependent methyltransferase
MLGYGEEMYRNLGQRIKETTRAHFYEFWLPIGLSAMSGLALLEMPDALLECVARQGVGEGAKCPSCGAGAIYNYGKGKHYSFCLICGKRFVRNAPSISTVTAHGVVRECVNEWNTVYAKCGQGKPQYDLWLDKYGHLLKESKDTPIIDLGCGYGNDTLYLYERGFKTISCDFSDVALGRLKYFIDDPVVRKFDMRSGLPFENDTAVIVVADLSLHYFSWEDTTRIVREIKRVLMGGGHLLCRVNSVNDRNYGAGQGILVEDHYYCVEGKFKRFFDRRHLEKLFSDWTVLRMSECEMDRYGKTKVLWEVAVRK